MIPFERAELTSRLRWFIQLRWVFGAGVLSAGLFLTNSPVGQVHGAWIAAVGGGILAYNWAFWFLERRYAKAELSVLARRAPLAASAQIILDLIALTLVLHASGGIENPFFIFYVFHIVIATLLLRARDVFALAALAIGLFALLVMAERNRWLQHYCLFEGGWDYSDRHFVAVTLGAFGSALLIAVYLGTSIAQTLRSRGREVQRLESELAARADELEATNQSLRIADNEKTQYFRKVSHDLKTPLAAQQSLLRALLIELQPMEADPRSRIERAIERGDELFALLNDLLMLSRARDVSRRRRRGFEWIDPVEALRGVLERQAIHAEEKGLRWQMEIADPVPRLCAEPGILPTLAENIISNAIKYTPEGGTVTFCLRGREKRLEMAARDTGIGIGKEDLDRIGQEFFRTKQARTSGSSGTGLGMTIVRSMVENMNGELDMQSELGVGTTVTISLPINPSPEIEGVDQRGGSGVRTPTTAAEAAKAR